MRWSGYSMRWSGFQDYTTFQQKALMNLGIIRGSLYRFDNMLDLRKLLSHFFLLPPPASNSYHDLSSPLIFIDFFFCIIPSHYHEEAPLLAITSLLHGQSSHHIPHTIYCQIYT